MCKKEKYNILAKIYEIYLTFENKWVIIKSRKRFPIFEESVIEQNGG